jgi:AcrR family transcriptional regulator
MAVVSRDGRRRGADVAPAAARHAGAGSARARLLSAALACFEADGALSTTLEQIRLEAGVSVGALYHHFPDKGALAGALYAERLWDFQQGFLSVLRSHADARQGVEAGVRFYLRWVSENRAAAAYLLAGAPDGADLRAANSSFFSEAMAWWQTHVHYGALRSLPFDLIHALWLGPAQEYCRHWVAGRAKRVPLAAADVLAESAWNALKETT